MKNYTNGPEMPIGFGMELAKDLNAMNVFSSKTEAQQRELIDRASQIQSKKEMESLVQALKSSDRFF